MIHKYVLDNGVRVLVEPVGHVKSAAIGLWCKTGSRHETEAEAGITHLIVHMLFKGTTSRTAKEIAEAIEGRGGQLNAFTDKEATCEQGISILVGGEEAGATLPYGCRMGICHTCVGVLREGQVRDLRSGEVHGEQGETVRTCVNAPEGHVVIEL